MTLRSRSSCKSLLTTLSALSKVGEALGCREGVGLQGEEVLLRKQEAGALRGLMEVLLWVLETSC